MTPPVPRLRHPLQEDIISRNDALRGQVGGALGLSTGHDASERIFA
jgi:hypothetical protein